MFSTRRLLQLIVAAVAASGSAVRAQPNVDRSSPQAVFAAYKRATNDRDWKTLFSLRTTQAQDGLITAMAIGAATSEENPKHPDEIRTYRAILAKHGIDWREVKRLVAATQATGGNDAFNKVGFLVPMQRIVARATNKFELYSSVGDFFQKRADASIVTVLRLENLVEDGSTSKGWSIQRSRVTMTVTDALGTRKVPQDGEGKSLLRFRRIEGEWFLE